MTCLHCENENLRDYPLCDGCARAFHFPHRSTCLHCVAAQEAERQAEPMLRLLELRRAYSDDVPLLMDMQSDLQAAMAAKGEADASN